MKARLPIDVTVGGMVIDWSDQYLLKAESPIEFTVHRIVMDVTDVLELMIYQLLRSVSPIKIKIMMSVQIHTSYLKS